MVLYIESLIENKVFKLENCNINSQILNIKKEIQSQEHVPFDEQVLYYNNQIMNEDEVVSSYLKYESELIKLVIIEKPFQIKLKTMFDKEIVIKNITSQTYVEEIFLILFYYYELHPDDLILTFKSTKLDKYNKLFYYKIKDNDLINIIIHTKTGFF